jgi:hypothetical protein
MSQREDILKHLKRHGSIGFFEALRLYKCKRPEARIHELRRDGHDIRTVRYDGVKWARYELAIPEQTELPMGA